MTITPSFPPEYKNCSLSSTKRQFTLCSLFALLAVFSMVLLTIQIPSICYAADGDYSFQNTDVLDDLKASTIDGEPFDIKDYPYRQNGNLQLINMVEYCYSFRVNQIAQYGLYLY